MKQRPPLLDSLLLKAQSQRNSGFPLQVIFDLDSTLFDVSPRIAKIFHAFAEIPEVSTKYPEAAQHLAAISPSPLDYGVKRTLMRVGFKPPSEEFIKILVTFWKEKFFSNEFLSLDRPYPGSRQFILDLEKAGAKIFYLTGRDIPRMLEGTIESLQLHGFPLVSDRSNLFLKPDSNIRDSEFKRTFFEKFEATKSETWFFENEPRNIELVLKHHPHIQVIFVATVHAGDHPEPGVHIPQIQGFEI